MSSTLCGVDCGLIRICVCVCVFARARVNLYYTQALNTVARMQGGYTHCMRADQLQTLRQELLTALHRVDYSIALRQQHPPAASSSSASSRCVCVRVRVRVRVRVCVCAHVRARARARAGHCKYARRGPKF